MPHGGRLSQKTIEDLERVLAAIRDPEYYNRPVILEVEADISVDLNRGQTANSTRTEIVRLRSPEDGDFLFSQYLKDTESAIRKVFRLPPLLTGSTEDYTNATSYASLEYAETQVFDPIRQAFDEQVTTELIQGGFGIYQWKLKTRPTRIGDKETFYRAAGAWSRAGGPSINQLIALGNEVFGTEWSQHEGPIYDEPVSVVSSLASQGRVIWSDGKLTFMEG